MVTEKTPHAWTCRPSLFVSRMLGFALAMLVALVAVFLFFEQSQMMWLVAVVPVALWVGFKGGPLLLRALERAVSSDGSASRTDGCGWPLLDAMRLADSVRGGCTAPDLGDPPRGQPEATRVSRARTPTAPPSCG